MPPQYSSEPLIEIAGKQRVGYLSDAVAQEAVDHWQSQDERNLMNCICFRLLIGLQHVLIE